MEAILLALRRENYRYSAEKVVEVIANVYLTLASLTMFPKILLAWQSKKISTETLA